MKKQMIAFTASLLLFSSINVFADPVIETKTIPGTYSIAAGGLLTDENKQYASLTEEKNVCYDNGVPYTGEIESNGSLFYFYNGNTVSYQLKEDGYHFYDSYGIETEYREDLVSALQTFQNYYELNQKSESPIYETDNLRDFYTLINMIGDCYSNEAYRGNLSNLIESTFYETEGKTIYCLNITSGEALQAFKENLKESQEYLNQFYSIFAENESKKEICEKVNNFIKANYDYNYEKAWKLTYENYQNTTTVSDMVLDEDSIICVDYANLYQFLCNLKGIETEVCYGTANGGGHAWNKQTIDGVDYYTDVTFNDTAYTDDWLLISKNKIMKDHVFY